MSDYPVGYGKPPKKTQFQKGQSGNPKGRPKGSTNPDELIRKLLFKPVTVTQNGKATKVPAIEALLSKIMSMAANGDHKALKLVWEMLKTYGQSPQIGSIAEVMAGCSSFELSPEEVAVVSKAKLLKGVS